MRKFLNNLQPLSSGKETLVGAGGTPQDMVIEGKSSKPKQTIDETEVRTKETSSVVSSLYIELLTEDITSEAGPSEKYWEVISERRRKALLEALEEHERLQAAAIVLEEENLSLEVSMDSITDLVNTLKEMINKETSDDDHEESNEQEDSGLSTPDSYSIEKHNDKKMKTSPDDISDIY
ncbi:geminin-like [Acyrthosiphon pisum]|uniref:Geminin n=1 Tax=Acyrthosiphon pisum TaxID=7029 RepID=A0A8R2H7T4_ACYPI|nr:geminin-like [Acyrthosiphon pisum]|eukprot:XP_016662840.1 PREDICTED: geminin-like [Acyrthosiphon pisum]